MSEYMAGNHQVPILVGVGEFKNVSRKMEDAIEPSELMLKAIHEAATDAIGPQEQSLIKDLDGVSVVASSTWPYTDLPGLLSKALHIQPKHTVYSDLSGNSSVQLIDDAAQRIASGELEAVAVVGGESLASLKDFMKRGMFPPPWTGPGTNLDNVYYANNVQTLGGIGKAHEVGVPMQVYAMYENGLRAHRGQTIAQNHQESVRLYARYAQVAASHQMAWSFGKMPETESSIGTVNRRNRMICFPYPLLMNAFNDVNLAAACIVTSQAYAERRGIPREKWIFPLGGGRGHDSEDSMAEALSTSLARSELRVDDIDIFDFYSCFPIVPKLACQYLGISIDNPPRPITLLGGLTSFGGAGANYSMHAVTEMVRCLRARRCGGHERSNGLILANGGVLTHENALCLSTRPRPNGTPYPVDEFDNNCSVSEGQVAVVPATTGEATIETYTVEYDRQNNPRLGHVVCRLKGTDSRVLANHGDHSTLQQLASGTEEPIGRGGFVWQSERPGQNLFSFRKSHL
ncbi:hypothetical protein ASPSYDRAFT_1158981 [Aspergillus sydowii CBS 593.65]|uniref:Thiolase-like protein type 1 additional C-terminal domain-containing protein n=1 Tax=Aspergillus sydowii CBS 593.65 TaxID=1036612 RepID=A0A1L9T7N2_9EURO|nr:uncharacterized protein ASPSYDRAFT_1158981 [Aspergillus sydowii CBS 593.65]OJJ55381.1 hypothetical protein ASPSYDRAFT_1158981 [Aspergillus sydowii CBS 593.65]